MAMSLVDIFLERGREEGREEGIQAGQQKKQMEVVLKMYEEGFSPEIIVKITGLSSKEVLQVLKNVKT